MMNLEEQDTTEDDTFDVSIPHTWDLNVTLWDLN